MRAQNSLYNFFKCMLGGFLILCIRSHFIKAPTIEVVQSLWYTFMRNFIISPWMGLAGMFMIDFYHWIKKNFFPMFDKISNSENILTVGGSTLIGSTTVMWFFNKLHVVSIFSWQAVIGGLGSLTVTFMGVIVGFVAKDVYKEYKPRVVKYVKRKRINNRQKRAA